MSIGDVWNLLWQNGQPCYNYDPHLVCGLNDPPSPLQELNQGDNRPPKLESNLNISVFCDNAVIPK